ncbi:MAG: aldolase [Acidobacteria bacterium]|nr:aldolase [Acidobacteriota bacterium]
MTPSRTLRIWREGGFVRVAAVGRVVEPWFTEVLGRLGFDVIWLDLEHRPWGYDVIDPISLACRATGVDLMARIRKSGYDSPMRALEFGANGLMVPHCRGPEEARQWVDWIKFPPIGRRGLDGVGADADFGLASTAEHLEFANRETFIALQIEDREAVDRIDEIAAVPGFDMLFIGPGDLSLSLGVPLQFDHPVMEDARRRIADAAARHGKYWGTTSGTPEAAQRAIDQGARMVTCGSDHGFLMGGARNAWAGFKEVSRR